MILKQLILFLSIIQLMQCLSTRSNIWWSRRSENSQIDCDFDLDYANPSLAAKICGYCFAKCEQEFGICLLAQIKEVANGSLDICEEKTNECRKHCFNDKRTSQIVEANWAKIVQILNRYNTLSTVEETKTE